MVKNLSYVICAAWNVFPINSLLIGSITNFLNMSLIFCLITNYSFARIILHHVIWYFWFQFFDKRSYNCWMYGPQRKSQKNSKNSTNIRNKSDCCIFWLFFDGFDRFLYQMIDNKHRWSVESCILNDFFWLVLVNILRVAYVFL